MTPFLDDYVDVPERIRLFTEKYPEGTLQGSGQFIRSDDTVVGYLYQAKAYRSPDDPRPGVGTAFEPIPGTTPYTKNSEVMNAETSAWGRAIVAVGIPSKKIASQQEVQARQDTPVALPSESRKVTKSQHAKIGAVIKELDRAGGEGADWVGYSRRWIGEQYGKTSRAELTTDEAGRLIEHLETHLEAASIPFG